ncbi:ATP-binding protein [Pseudomonas sp. sp1636]|uniref:sensor histidine kinase n=1 Tax=Pseudomonas sp. sp1636 TaxID=3036707 RepID=UPI0025A4DE37|nr:ATP-binding protein [Pseudomonas sp. sp1636]MDM8348798.1 ATP-binding protein [Pseudomonas sp. sp1636]
MHLLPERENSPQESPSATAGRKDRLRAAQSMSRPGADTGTPFPLPWLAGGLLLSVVVLLAMLGFAFDSLRSVTTVQLRDLRLQELSGRIVHLDEVLSMSARMAATTGDLQWERRYRQSEPQLDAAIKTTLQLTRQSESAEASAQTDAANLKLVAMENQAFALVRAGQHDQAKQVLFSEAYEAQKLIYAEGIIRLVQDIQQHLAASQRDKRRQAIFFVSATMASIVLLLVTWLLVWSKLHRWRADQAANFAALAKAEEALQIAHDDLEQRVKERTEQLEQLHKQLLEASRKAGMAEVATGVLHNVGNVLNSVNVSATLVADSISKSKVSGLLKAVALLQEHQLDLGTYLSSDPRGRLLPAYLSQLAEYLQADQEASVKELEFLRQNIDHIKEIVAMQQSFASESGVEESVDVRELLEDSLRMNLSSLSRHGVEVIREIDAVPPIMLDKHKVLQILVNLVSNARHACDDSERTDKRLTLRLTSADGRVRLSVTDNGAGIAAENLTRIFNHGFTTRKGGHGFGLHSGALAAKELGGSLLAQSDGVGLGATFTLELPLTPLEVLA